MKKKHKKHSAWNMLLLIMVALLPAVFAVREAKASSLPALNSLTIHNYALTDMDDTGLPNDGKPAANIPADAKPLAGVEFTIWQVDPVVAASLPTVSQAWSDILPATKQTGVTGSDGTLKFDHLPDGLYYVAETGNSGTDKVVFGEPFLVNLPMVDPIGGAQITDVYVYPKNQSVVIDKFVGNAGDTDYDTTDYNASKYKPVAVDTAFGWSILSSIPASLGTGVTESYVVTDKLDNCFTYVAGSLKVYAVPTMGTSAASGWVLNEGSDYTLNFHSGSNTLTIELTASGIARLGSRYTNDQDRFLLIKYDCRLNSSAPQGERIYSSAEVEYTKTSTAAGTTSAASAVVAVEPAVHTGQIGITKYKDGSKETLAGAQFGLAKTKADAQAGNFIAAGGTDSQGKLTFSGLAYGSPGDGPSDNTGNTTYWLMETKAPDGYQLVKEPVEVTFHYQQDSDTGEYYFTRMAVYNVQKGAAVPEGQPGSKNGSPFVNVKTGDTSMLFPILGVILLSLAVIAVVIIYWQKQRTNSQKHWLS